MLLLAAPLQTDAELDLDQIIQNVYDNNEWRLHPIGEINDVAKRRAIQRGQKEIENIKENATTTFFAYNHLHKGISPKIVAEKYELSYQKVLKWKHAKDIPHDLKPYRTSYLPQSGTQLDSLIFSLGVFARSLTSSHIPRRLKRKIIHPLRRKKFCHSLSDLTGLNIQTNTQEVTHTNELLVHTLNYVLHHAFDQYVTKKDHNRLFLKGYLSPKNVNLRKVSGRFAYIIFQKYELPVHRALSSFFNLDIFPYVTPAGNKMEIFGQYNLEKMVSNALFANPHNNKTFRKFILQPNNPIDTLSAYNSAREITQAYIDNNQLPNWVRLGNSFEPPIPISTLTGWVADIVKTKNPNFATPQATPAIVENYNYLATLLGKN